MGDSSTLQGGEGRGPPRPGAPEPGTGALWSLGSVSVSLHVRGTLPGGPFAI